MDDHRQPSGASPSSLFKTEPLVGGQQPAGFTPMELVLVPTGMSIELKRPDLVMGRHSSADLRLPLADVSRRHCRFLFADGHWHLLDLDSLNGVFVNEKRVQRTALRHLDRIRVGSFTFEVRLHGNTSAAAQSVSSLATVAGERRSDTENLTRRAS